MEQRFPDAAPGTCHYCGVEYAEGGRQCRASWENIHRLSTDDSRARPDKCDPFVARTVDLGREARTASELVDKVVELVSAAGDYVPVKALEEANENAAGYRNAWRDEQMETLRLRALVPCAVCRVAGSVDTTVNGYEVHAKCMRPDERFALMTDGDVHGTASVLRPGPYARLESNRRAVLANGNLKPS